MPGKSGIDAIPDVLHDAPEAKVLVLSMQDDPSYVREAFAAGASGYVLKEAADTEVVAAIREVAARRPLRPPGARRAARRRRGRGAEAGARTTRSPTASARCCGCSRSATRTRRSRRSSTSPCAPPRRTGRTSCRSCGLVDPRRARPLRARARPARARARPVTAERPNRSRTTAANRGQTGSVARGTLGMADLQ